MSVREKKQNSGFALFGLLVGLATGFALYAVAQYLITANPEAYLPKTAFCAIVFFSAAFLLLSSDGAIVRAIPPAAVIAAILAGPTWFMLTHVGKNELYAPFPIYGWFFVGGPIAAYLMTTLAKASLEERTPPPYRAVFFHGLTLPLIAAG
ncbi:MAG TPA: hypothetical protein VNH64_10075, partial [Parvularculaceae bacterium]|nr:hypothetical protein [Parvularculaceae bacterium]